MIYMPCLESFYRISKHVGEDINIVKPILMKKFPNRTIYINLGREVYHDAILIYTFKNDNIIRVISFS
jgi:hypothetical protein